MDTHDTHSIPGNTPLQPGMALTIEPGLYIDSADDVPQQCKMYIVLVFEIEMCVCVCVFL
jgi:Xaa-Pro aminopeptidase